MVDLLLRTPHIVAAVDSRLAATEQGVELVEPLASGVQGVEGGLTLGEGFLEGGDGTFMGSELGGEGDVGFRGR